MAEKSHTSRLTSYKNAGQGLPEQRRKRAELSLSLRKQAREEQLLKRRAVSPEGEAPAAGDAEPAPAPEDLVRELLSSELPRRTAAARAARRQLSREQNPPIAALVRAGLVPPLVDALRCDHAPELQFEAAWALTNIASGAHQYTQAVIDAGAVPALVELLSRSAGAVCEQAAWALGNVAGDGPGGRDAVLAAGALSALQPHLRPGAAPALLRTAVWTYSNLCRNKNPQVPLEQVAPALPLVAELLEHTDQDVLADACWALSYLTDGPDERIEAAQRAPRLPERLAALLGHSAPAVQAPALRALGNMLTGTDEQTDRCIAAGCLPRLAALLAAGRAALVKEAAWACSNVLAGTRDQIQAALDRGLLAPLVATLEHSDPKCQKEAAWALTNICLGGSAAQLDALLAAGFLRPYCALLAAPDARAVLLALDGLARLLEAATRLGRAEPLALELEELGALDALEKLQGHEHEQIYKKSLQILDTYFAESETDENLAPPAAPQHFTFDARAPPADIQF